MKSINLLYRNVSHVFYISFYSLTFRTRHATVEQIENKILGGLFVFWKLHFTADTGQSTVI